jgi:hypothetical protein
MMVLLLTACRQVQTPATIPVPSRTPTAHLTPVPLPTQTTHPAATVDPTSTYPFRRITSLTDQLPKLYTQLDVQVRAPADGSVWVITRQAAARWDGQTWDPIHILEEGMLADVDESGRLWVLPQDVEEIRAWQNGEWAAYSVESGWTSAHINLPWRITSRKDGTLWLPTAMDVRSFDGKRWTIHSLTEMGFPVPEEEDRWILHQITAPDAGEQTWIGECYWAGPGPVGGAGVRWRTDQTWQGASAPVGPVCVSVIHVDLVGNVWIGVPDAVWRYEPGSQTWTSLPVPDTSEVEQYNFTYPIDLVVDASGDAWIHLQYCGGASCDTGHTRLYRVHNGEWSQIFDMQEYSILLGQLALTGSGQGWLFWDGSVYQLSGDVMEPVTALAAIGMDVSPEGRLWAVTSDGNDSALWTLEP